LIAFDRFLIANNESVVVGGCHFVYCLV